LNLSGNTQRFCLKWIAIVPWAALVELIAPYYPDGRKQQTPFTLETVLRVRFMQQWFTMSNPPSGALNIP
jgi:hypothetical protein